MKLARAIHFDESDSRVFHNPAPSLEAAHAVALEEIAQMAELCADHDPNTLLTVARELTDAGVRESYRVIAPEDADLTQFAVHGSLDEPHGH